MKPVRLVMRVSLVCIFFSLFGSVAFAQKKFKVVIEIAGELNPDSLQVLFENGKTLGFVKEKFTNSKIIISDSFYCRYASVYIHYPNTHSQEPFRKSFFVDERPAHILINSAGIENPLAKCVLKNAFDMDDVGAVKLQRFIGEEKEDLDRFVSAFSDKMVKNDSLAAIYFNKERKLADKKIEFIKSHPNLYYACWLFRTQIMHRESPGADTLLSIFKAVFPVGLQRSVEGVRISTFLNDKVNTKIGHIAPNFIATDINGRSISLNQFKDKYVLLNFWASWCIPCMEEMPKVKMIRDRYPEEKLVIIGINSDKNRKNFENAVQHYSMNWMHITGEWDFKRIYAHSLPQVYLIDRSGRVIYSRQDEQDFKLLNLEKLLANSIN